MAKDKEVARAYKDIRQDYEFRHDIFSTDTERVAAVKEIISRMDAVDQTLIILYIDCKSFRKLGARLGFSHMTVRHEIRRIKDHIFKELEKYDLH